MKKLLALIRNALHVAGGVLVVSEEPKMKAIGAGMIAVATGWSQKNTKPPTGAVPVEVPTKRPRPTSAPLMALTAAMAIAVLSSGCSTTPQQAQRVQSAAKVAAYVGTHTYLAEHPHALPSFLLARDELLRLEQAETVDLATLVAIVNRLPIKELKSDTAVMVITAATILLSDYIGELPVERLEELRPLVRALRVGIELGLPAP